MDSLGLWHQCDIAWVIFLFLFIIFFYQSSVVSRRSESFVPSFLITFLHLILPRSCAHFPSIALLQIWGQVMKLKVTFAYSSLANLVKASYNGLCRPYFIKIWSISRSLHHCMRLSNVSTVEPQFDESIMSQNEFFIVQILKYQVSL